MKNRHLQSDHCCYGKLFNVMSKFHLCLSSSGKNQNCHNQSDQQIVFNLIDDFWVLFSTSFFSLSPFLLRAWLFCFTFIRGENSQTICLLDSKSNSLVLCHILSNLIFFRVNMVLCQVVLISVLELLVVILLYTY